MGKVKDAAMVANATSQAMVEKKKLKSKIVLFKHDEMETARIENAKRKIEKAKMQKAKRLEEKHLEKAQQLQDAKNRVEKAKLKREKARLTRTRIHLCDVSIASDENRLGQSLVAMPIKKEIVSTEVKQEPVSTEVKQEPVSMEVKKEPPSANVSEASPPPNFLNHSERPVQVKEEAMSSSSSAEDNFHDPFGEESSWQYSEYSFDTNELAYQLKESMSFHFNIKIAQLALVITKEDFFTNLRASQELWTALEAISLDMVSQISRERLKDDSAFYRWCAALRWKDVLAARVISIYAREARNNFEGNDFVGENQELYNWVNSAALEFDYFDADWGPEKEHRLRMWMFLCKGFSSNWVDQAYFRLGRQPSIQEGQTNMLICCAHTDAENLIWQDKYSVACIQVFGKQRFKELIRNR